MIQELKQKYPKRDIYMIHYEDIDTSFNIPLDALANPFDYTPKIQVLTQKEHKLLAKLEKQNGWIGEEFITLRKLQLKRGQSNKQSKTRKENLYRLLKECEERGLKLPENFIKLFQDDKLFNRFRLGSSIFSLPRKLTYFPEKKDTFIICFHEDWECCFRYYLVIDLKGNHCIMLNNNDDIYPYENTDKYSEEELGIFIMADSFEEYIIKISAMIRIQEGDSNYLEKTE